MIKKVRINFEWWDCAVEIEQNQQTLDYMKEQLLFWSGGQRRIDKENGDIEKAYLKMLGYELILMSIDYNLYGILSEFKDKEGWYSLDGSYGVKLISIDEWEFDKDEFYIEEI